MWCAAHVQHLWWLWRWCLVILREDDGTSDVPPMCFSIPPRVFRPSILSWRVVEVRVGEPDLEHDGRHAPAVGVFI